MPNHFNTVICSELGFDERCLGLCGILPICFQLISSILPLGNSNDELYRSGKYPIRMMFFPQHVSFYSPDYAGLDLPSSAVDGTRPRCQDTGPHSPRWAPSPRRLEAGGLRRPALRTQDPFRLRMLVACHLTSGIGYHTIVHVLPAGINLIVWPALVRARVVADGRLKLEPLVLDEVRGRSYSRQLF